MKISKKSILYSLIFISAIILTYFIIVAFSYNIIDFSPFYKSESTTQEIDEDKIMYTLNSDNEIVYVINDNDDFIVYKIKDNNVLVKHYYLLFYIR